jgi:quercetin dioxygenase-like cupin family protein
VGGARAVLRGGAVRVCAAPLKRRRKRHGHPAGYVLEGSLEYHVDGESPRTLSAGDVLFVPPETPHAVRNVGRGNAAELASTSPEAFAQTVIDVGAN